MMMNKGAKNSDEEAMLRFKTVFARLPVYTLNFIKSPMFLEFMDCVREYYIDPTKKGLEATNTTNIDFQNEEMIKNLQLVQTRYSGMLNFFTELLRLHEALKAFTLDNLSQTKDNKQ